MGKIITLDEAKQRFIDIGLIPLFEEYNNAHERLLAQTKEGYLVFATLNHLKSGRGVRIFDQANIYTVQNIHLWCKLNNKPFELLSEKYKNQHDKLKWKCLKEDCKEEFDLNWKDTQQLSICPYCAGMRTGLSNCIATRRPDLIKYFKNKEDAFKYTIHSDRMISVVCPDCGFGKNIMIGRLTNRGISCPKCGDGVSYPEKFISNILDQLTTKFEFHKRFDWSNNKEYDFYIPILNIIIETHGLQHYKETSWISVGGRTLEAEQENDILKKELALKNNFEYIEIDCRYSKLDFIKQSILNCDLPQLLNFQEEDIDWLKCHEYAVSNLVKITCDLWNKGDNLKRLMSKLKLSDSTLKKYLKQGTQLGLCDYNPHKEVIKNYKNISKQIICLNTNEIFNSITEAHNKYNILVSNISVCCRNIKKSAGKHPITGEKLIWMYYEDWKVKQNELALV